MTLSSLRQLLTDSLSADLDNYRGETPSPTDLNAQLNWAYRIIARKCVLTTDTPLYLVQGQSAYNLRDVTTPTVGAKIIRPVVVYINRSPLFDAAGRDYGMWTYDELVRLYPTWKQDGQGRPTKAVFTNWNQLILHPAPDAATVSQTHAIYGTYLPNDLSLDADAPQVPEEIHEAIAWLAAQFAATPTITEQEGWMRLQKFSEYWSQIIQEVADQNERTFQSWGSTSGYYESDLIRV
jgi:hypothetical protein